MVLSRVEGLPSTAPVFEGQEGRICLRRLFGDRQRLAVYHMAAEGIHPIEPPTPGLDTASCLRDRNTRMVLVSRAPYAILQQYRQYLGFALPCYSTTADILTGSDDVDFWDLVPALSLFRFEQGEVVRTITVRVPGLDFLTGALDLLEQRTDPPAPRRYCPR